MFNKSLEQIDLTMFQEHQKQIELARNTVPQYFQTAEKDKKLNDYIRQ